MRTKVRKRGNSLGARIRKAFAEEAAVGEGSTVEFDPRSGVVLADRLKSLAWSARQARSVEAAPPKVVEEVLAKALTLLEGSGP
jgi:antitoxin component of MazEF toxin-antitoxin module